MPLIQALRRQRQVYLYEFKACLVNRANSRTTRVITQKKPCHEKPESNNNNNKKSPLSRNSMSKGYQLIKLSLQYSNRDICKVSEITEKGWLILHENMCMFHTHTCIYIRETHGLFSCRKYEEFRIDKVILIYLS